MATETGVATPLGIEGRDRALIAMYAEGIRAGLVGAAVIALWFFVLDVAAGRPLYTPTVLGTAFLRGVSALDGGVPVVPSLELVLSFTWIHTLIFLLVGIAAAWLIALAERDPNYGFGIVLLLAIFESGFIVTCMLVAEPVLHALTWPAVVVGNLVAALAMAATFWPRHRRLVIAP